MYRFFKLLNHKYRYYKLVMFKNKVKIGKNFKGGKYGFISKKNKIDIGDNFFMGNFCHLSSDLKVGNDVMFASFVSCVGGDHNIDDVNIKMNKSGKGVFKKTIIEDNVWIGHGTIIMHGVSIKEGSVIAAGSVVIKNVPSLSIYGGNPAKLIKKR